MAVERRQKVVLAALVACFAVFAAQVINIQLFANTKPPTLAALSRPVAQKPVATKPAKGFDIRFQRWWQRNVQARVQTAPNQAKRALRVIWRKLGAA